jgi:hypothetical protein
MIPTGGSIDTQNIEPIEHPSRTWRLDFERGRVVGMVDGLDAVRQAVFLILHTERFRYLIFGPDYGMEWNGLIGANPVYIRSELKRRITDALMQDDRIENVTDFQIDIAGDTATVRFTVVSAFGTSQEEVTARV